MLRFSLSFVKNHPFLGNQAVIVYFHAVESLGNFNPSLFRNSQSIFSLQHLYSLLSHFLLPICVLSLLLSSGCQHPSASADTIHAVALPDQAIPAPKVQSLHQYMYGIDISGLEITQDEWGKNQVMGEVLTTQGVDYPVIAQMVEAAKGFFDIRTFRPGKPYTLLHRQDSSLAYFIYEKNKVEYVVWELTDTVEAYMARKPVDIQEREATGVIYSSLYGTIQDQDLDIGLASQLEEIYAWSLDFFHTQKGDWFKVVYNEGFVDGESIGIQEIKSAAFQHGERTFYAIGFEQDGRMEFFDEKGGSLRKAFLKAPLNYTRISSGFTYRRYHPILKRSRPHLGIDYAAPTGTPIRSVGDGTIIKAAYSRGNGRFIKVKHNSTYATQYLHMSRFASGMKTGMAVKQGDIIGYVGSTGLSTGPHLCFRFWQNGRQVNPNKIEAPSVEPISDALRPAFMAVKNVVKHRLDGMDLPEPPVMEADKELATR